MGLTTTWIKIIVLIALLFLTLIFSMLPLRLLRAVYNQPVGTTRRRYSNVLSLLSCYAAGVFLATCLLDLFPEVQQSLGIALDMAGLSTNYPLPEFVMVFGFFVILIVEQMVLTFSVSTPLHHHEHNEQYEPLLDSEQLQQEQHEPNSRARRYRTLGRSFNNTSCVEQTCPTHDLENSGAEDESLNDAIVPSVQTVTSNYSSETENSIENEADRDDMVGNTETTPTDQEVYTDPSSHSLIRSLILLVALSMHSIFEGLAIGLQPTNSDVMHIFVPVALHKSILAFSLGLSLVQSRMSTAAAIMSNGIFCIASPIGIGIGVIVIDLSPDTFTSALVNGILQGIACGTFLYVVFFEILPHEFMAPRVFPSRLLKTLFLIFGYSTVALLLFLDPDIVLTRKIKDKYISPGESTTHGHRYYNYYMTWHKGNVLR